MSRTMNQALERLIRMGVLEGYAGVKPGTWTGCSNGWTLVQEAFPNLICKWWDESDLTLLKAIRSGVASRELRKEDREDLVEEIVAGLTAQNGEAYKVGVWFGKLKWIGLTGVATCLKQHGWHRGISAVRDAPREELRATVEMEAVDEETLDVFLHTHREAIWRLIRSDLSTMWGTAPARMALFDAIIANPDLGDVALARALGHGEGTKESWIDWTGAATGISRTRRMIRDTIPEIIRRNPSLCDMVSI